jgi:predicted nucleotidyltransferase
MALEKLNTLLREQYGAVDVRLYGSKARGTDTAESDVDVLVVLPSSTRDLESRIDDDIYEINLEHDCLISAVYFTEVELKAGSMAESPLYKRVVTEGVRL